MIQTAQACKTGIIAVFVGVATIFGVTASCAQDQPIALNLEDFDGFEDWPLKMPGDLVADNVGLSDQRIVFEALFPGPQGLGGPLQETTMIMDLLNVYFRGEPALWVQWTSTGRAGAESGTSALDYLVVDRKTHRTLHRVQSVGGPDGPRTRAGPLNIWHFPDDAVTQTLVQEDGSAATTRTEVDDAGTIDYAALQFWLPFIELEEGMKFRIPYYFRRDQMISGLPVYVKGRDKVKDAQGRDREVWRVQIMSNTGRSMSEFWISQEAPYFLGWDVRIAANSKPVTQMRYKKHWMLDR